MAIIKDIIKDIDDREMPLLEHLLELRNRLIYSLGALFVGVIVSYFFSKQIYAFLAQPLADILGADRRMIFTNLTEPFFTYLRVAFWAGAFVTFPFIATQVWMFIAPGLYRNEKQAFLPFLVATPVLFFTGGAFVYYFVFPVAWRFFVGFETPAGDGGMAIQLEARVSEYLDLVMKLIFAFGIAFEMPVVLTLLGRVGIISSAGLARNRRYAIVGVFVFAAIITPPDIISQIGLAIPMIALYEVSVLAVRQIERARARREAAAAASE